VREVIVAGRPVVTAGRHVGIDVAADLASAIEAVSGELFSYTERNSS
jgi:hypothetical protein